MELFDGEINPQWTLKDFNMPDSDEFVIMPGRQIFNLLSITGLNKSPINKLTAYILAGELLLGTIKPPLYNIQPLDVTNHLLVDGTFAIYLGEFIPNIIEATKSYLITNTCDNKGKVVDNIRRIYFKFDNMIVIIDQELKKSGMNVGEWETVFSIEISPSQVGLSNTDEMLYIYPNGPGLLFPAQRAFYRLEEIEQTIKGETDESALATIITGSYAADLNKAKNEFRKNRKRIFLPGQDINIHNVFNGDAVDKMVIEQQTLLPLYREALFDYITPDTISMSGISRRLAMLPTINFVINQRKILIDLYEMFGGVLTFEAFSIIDSQEKSVELQNVQFSYDNGAITLDEYHSRIRHLMAFSALY